MKRAAKRVLAGMGLEVRKARSRHYDKYLLFEDDERFTRHYEAGMRLTQTPDSGEKRRARFYNLAQFFEYVGDVAGRTAECGCWKGLSSYVLCQYRRDREPAFDGTGHEIYDSFAGLSPPGEADAIVKPALSEALGDVGGRSGEFAGDFEWVKATSLGAFPGVAIHRGWIPDVFAQAPAEGAYRFVHIDVDLFEPTRDAIAHFYPRLTAGGVIVCDDYGSLRWPGAKRAVEEYCAAQGIRFIALSSGQAVIFKPQAR